MYLKKFNFRNNLNYFTSFHQAVSSHPSQKLILRTRLSLTLIHEFLGLSPSVISGRKSKIITGDVTVGTPEMKIICADKVPVRLSYDINFKWHMPIWGEICSAEEKYMPFLGPSPSVIYGENPKHRNINKWRNEVRGRPCHMDHVKWSNRKLLFMVSIWNGETNTRSTEFAITFVFGLYCVFHRWTIRTIRSIDFQNKLF